MKSRAPFRSVLTAFAIFLSLAGARAQLTVTNSATLSVSIVGSNLILRADFDTTNGAFTIVQGERPDALRLPAYASQISNQIFDIGWVPPARTAQWTLTNWSVTPARFFRLEFEPFLSRGRAFVFKDGPLDFNAMRQAYGDITNNFQQSQLDATNTTPVIFRQPVEVWVDNLGTYDTNGVLVGKNENTLTGKYGVTHLLTISRPDLGMAVVPRLSSTNNDFRVNFLGDSNVPAREAVVWSSEVQMFHDINDYRNRFLNDAFIAELHLPLEIERNLTTRQFRPDLMMFDFPTRFGNSILSVFERESVSGIRLFPWENSEQVAQRTRGPILNFAALPPLSLCYDTENTVSDYAGLVAFWILGTNTGFPSEAFFGQNNEWQSNMLPALNDGLSSWVSYRYSGNTEVHKYSSYAYRIWAGRPCGGTNIPCDKGYAVRNVMMFDEVDASRSGVFPFRFLANTTNNDGPGGSDLAGQYIGAIFYDVANEAGLGVHKSDLLIWKTISLITDNVTFPMRAFGAKVQEAGRALWPDPRPGRAGLSLYEEDINDVLTSRGIPLNGVSDFRTNLPPALRPTLRGSETQSSHPNNQPNVNQYGTYQIFTDEFTLPGNTANYIAYTFYKHSKYGPCDYIELQRADGTYTNGIPNPDGSVVWHGEDRDLGNMTIFVPSVSAKSNTVRIVSYRGRCANEAIGFYAEDVKPFGYSIIKATPNGFSFTATALSETASTKSYHLTIVDPSIATLGAASYAWNFTNYLGQAEAVTGSTAPYTALKDQPFTLSITRTRGSETNTLTLRERGNDLDRNGGNAFIRNLIP